MDLFPALTGAFFPQQNHPCPNLDLESHLCPLACHEHTNTDHLVPANVCLPTPAVPRAHTSHTIPYNPPTGAAHQGLVTRAQK